MEVIDGVSVVIEQNEQCPSLWHLSSPDMRGLLVIGHSADEVRNDAPAVIRALRGAQGEGQ